jgi:hypothetical protein
VSYFFPNDLYLVLPTRYENKIKMKINLNEENLDYQGKFNTI